MHTSIERERNVNSGLWFTNQLHFLPKMGRNTEPVTPETRWRTSDPQASQYVKHQLQFFTRRPSGWTCARALRAMFSFLCFYLLISSFYSFFTLCTSSEWVHSFTFVFSASFGRCCQFWYFAFVSCCFRYDRWGQPPLSHSPILASCILLSFAVFYLLLLILFPRVII